MALEFYVVALVSTGEEETPFQLFSSMGRTTVERRLICVEGNCEAIRKIMSKLPTFSFEVPASHKDLYAKLCDYQATKELVQSARVKTLFRLMKGVEELLELADGSIEKEQLTALYELALSRV